MFDISIYADDTPYYYYRNGHKEFPKPNYYH